VSTAGELVAAAGDVERRFFFRSAAKPFQAIASQEAGADLRPEQMAVACASHGGQPVHVAIVERMLSEVGLGEHHLRCPPAWPSSDAARDRLVASGARGPRPIWHNCSGKHAAMLRACVAQGWSTATYLDAEHPLQQRVYEMIETVAEETPGPVGVDQCGVPVHRVGTRGLARAYARLGTEPRLRAAWIAMHRFPPLTADAKYPAARIAVWLDAAAKHGAEGCLGVAIRDRLGVAVKSWDGSQRGVAVGMIDALRRLGLVPEFIDGFLEPVARPPVLGGGVVVGRVEPVVRLDV
jgi:L-asparaginase II